MNVLFKTPQEEKEYKEAPEALRLVADYFIYLSINWGVQPVVTRLLRPVAGESGVHKEYRAIDFRDEIGVGGLRLYTPGQVESLVNAMNLKFPRDDKRLVCIHHAFVNHAEPTSNRAPYHYHLQIPWAWKHVGLPDPLKKVYEEIT